MIYVVFCECVKTRKIKDEAIECEKVDVYWNIGNGESARHNVFSIIEGSRMWGCSAERYLASLLERLKVSKDGGSRPDSCPALCRLTKNQKS